MTTEDEDRQKVLEHAIDAYRRALEIYTVEHDPKTWAITQNNLGNVYANLPSGDRRRYLNKLSSITKQLSR